MKKPLNAVQAFSRAAALCSGAEQCRSDVERKLRTWGLLPADVRAVSERLETEGFLSEERYCRAFVHDKLRFNHWGRRKIAYALKGKQISSTLIETALAEMDEEEYRETAAEWLQSKSRTLRSRCKDERELSQRLFVAAAAAGFEAHLVSGWLREHNLQTVCDD